MFMLKFTHGRIQNNQITLSKCMNHFRILNKTINVFITKINRNVLQKLPIAQIRYSE